jgi:DNA-binding transcriptional regulator GbsR (MarR family)
MTKLSPIQKKLILHWGELGTRWDMNRTVAQIHAFKLGHISPQPINAEEIAPTLDVARLNVSNSIGEQQRQRQDSRAAVPCRLPFF